MIDNLGDRMKFYETLYGGDTVLMPLVPAIARLDGRAFHNFTRGLVRPFDHEFSQLMENATYWLVHETGAVAGYTQSDEISLIWFQETYKSQLFFNGRVQKLQSVLASQCSVRFNRLLPEYLPQKKDLEPVFDCRVWSVPTQEEAVNYLIWRQKDATRNSITMAAQSYYSHKELQGKNGNEKQEMLFQKGINWSEYPPRFKNGVLLRRVPTEAPFTAEEIEKLPAKHAARENPGLLVKRHAIFPSCEVLTKIPAYRRVDFIFGKGIENGES
jgi:tRNA(His) 5'-end guanylyltransferase